MRVRFTLATSLAATALLVPLGGVAQAVTTTSAQIVYTADPDNDGFFNVYTMPADGSADGTLLFASTTDEDMPSLSRDNSKLVYVDDVADTGEYHVEVRAANGSGSATELATGDNIFPSWSFDGGTVTYSHFSGNAFDVYTVPATGGTATLRATNASDSAFTPSGRQLLVDTFTAGGNHDHIDLVTLSSGSRAKIAGTEGGGDANVSPDGQTVVFTKPISDCEVGLFSVPIGGGTPTLLHAAAGMYESSAQYSTDGTQIFWSESPACGDTFTEDVWVMNANGSSPTVVRATASIDEDFPTVSGGTPPTADAVAPDAPVVNAAGTFTTSSATISWTDASTDASEYVVIRQAHGDPAPTSTSDGTLVYDGAAHSATASGLTPGTTYDFYVFALDATGNVSAAPSAVHPVLPTATPVLTGIGTVSTVSLNTTVTLAWTGSAAAYQVLYGEKYKSAAGIWTSAPVYHTLVSSTTGHSTPFTGNQGHSYAFQVHALDGFGNRSSSYGFTWADEPLNENYRAISYSAGWTAISSSARWLATYRYTVTAGRTITLTSETERFQVIGDKCAVCGAFRVYVDGVLKATIDTYASSTVTRRILFTSGVYSGLHNHTIKIVSLGTYGRPRINIDAIGLLRR